MVPAVVDEVLRAPGRPLDGDVRTLMEPRFGHDFSRVRVHTGALAEASAQAVGALAYTVGNQVVFGNGQFDPSTRAGRRLLAHELGHVVQQSRTPASTELPKLARGPHMDRLEHEVDTVASSIADGERSGDRLVTNAAPGTLQRQAGGAFVGGGGSSGGAGASGSWEPLVRLPPSRPGPSAAATTTPLVCSRPLDFPWWTGLRNFRHAFINDPPANYAIRGLRSGNGVTTSCSEATDASGPPDIPATSTCKPCLPPRGQTVADVSRCLRRTHTAYPSPNLYRNLPDPSDGWRHGPNSNSYAAAMARCCDRFSPAGLGRLPGWDHSPAGPCPTAAAPRAPVPSGGAPVGGRPGAQTPDTGLDRPGGIHGPAPRVSMVGEDKAPTNLHAFGNRTKPRDPRLGTDLDPNPDGTVGPEPRTPPWLSGASTFGNPDKAPLTGPYHRLAGGSPMKEGIRVMADGSDVGGPHLETHHTIFPARQMPFAEFVDKFQGLGWAYAGKKQA